MKKYWIRMVSLALCAAMLLGTAPAAFAQELETIPETAPETIPVTVPETVSETIAETYPVNEFLPFVDADDAFGDVRYPTGEIVEDTSGAMAVADAPVFTSPEEAGAYIRWGMKERREEIALIYQSDTQLDGRKVIPMLINTALAHTGDPTEGDYLHWQYAGWKAGFTNGGTSLTIRYTLSYYTTPAQEAEMDAAVARTLAELDLAEKTDYEKIRAIYDFVCDTVTYDYENLSDGSYKLKYTAYAALINGTAVCQGYAVLMYRLLLEAGVDCRVITGTGNGGPHAWNIVRLGDVYYNLDATWDAGRSSYSYFLKSPSGFGNHVPGSDFTTEQFNREYPMSETDYTPPDPSVVYDENGICYSIRGDHAAVIGYTGEMREAVIQGMIQGVPVTEIEEGAFRDCTALESLTLPEQVERIGGGAFRGCTGLRDVYYGGTAEDRDVIAIGSGNEPLEKARWHYAPSEAVTVPMYRLYNPYTLEHLFTGSAVEYDSLGRAGWIREGVAWYAPEKGDPVYRLYNPDTDGHFYTVSQDEKDKCTADGWILDGVVTRSADPDVGIPIFRMFNPFEERNYHHYTVDENERDTLISAGWVYENPAWCAAGQ